MRRSLARLAVAGLLAGCQPPHDRPARTAAPSAPGDGTPHAAATDAVIRGEATYLERVKMPPGAELTVRLVDGLLADTPAAVIAETRVADAGGPPIAFALRYDPARLRTNGRYGLHAQLRGPDGELWFVTDARVPVAPGDAARVEVRLRRVDGVRPATPGSRLARAAPPCARSARSRAGGPRSVPGRPRAWSPRWTMERVGWRWPRCAGRATGSPA